MRLEEWQQYIESQFLVGADEAKDKAGQTVEPIGSAEKQTEKQSVLSPQKAWETTPLEIFLPEERSQSADKSHLFEEAGVPADSLSMSSTLPAGPGALPKSVRHSLTSEEIAFLQSPILPLPAFPSADDLKADIPSFDRYLPASHPAAQSDPLLIDDFASSPLQPCEDSTNSTEEEDTLPVVAEAASPDIIPSLSPTRLPRSRARHARNVCPEHVPSGLSAADLWAQVPRHVQTLLAQEREQEAEVAQTSYKRPFQENRRELIARLLDPILSLEDTARLLNVCPATVRRYTNKGILTCYRKETEQIAKSGSGERETRQRRFRLSDILVFLETQQAALEADRQAERADENRKTNSYPDEMERAEP